MIWRLVLAAGLYSSLLAPLTHAQPVDVVPAASVEASKKVCGDSLASESDTLAAVVLKFLDAAGEGGACVTVPQGSFVTGDFKAVQSNVASLDEALSFPSVIGCDPKSPLCAEWLFTTSLQDRLGDALAPAEAAQYLLAPRKLNSFGDPEPAGRATPPDVVGDDGFRLDAPESVGELLLAAVESTCGRDAHARLSRLYEAAGDEGPQTKRIREELGSTSADTVCRDGIRTAGNILLFRSYLQRAYAQTLEAATFNALAERAELHYARWDAYNFGGGGARVQLPWELWLNGRIYQRLHPDQNDIWPEPPRSAVTLIHPAVGLAPYDIDGLESGVIGVVELLGYSRWDYSKENRRKNEWGASIAAVYAQKENGPSWHPGAVVRTPYFGLNIVYARLQSDENEGEADLFALSVDASKLFTRGGLSKSLACEFSLPLCGAP